MFRKLLVAALTFLLCNAAWADTGATIDIQGVSDAILDNVRGNLSLYQQREHPLLSEAVIQRLHGLAPEEIRHALEPFGFYRPHIDAELLKTGDHWTARYVIDTGPRIKMDKVAIELRGAGSSDSALLNWRATYPIQVGDGLDHALYERSKQELLQLTRERGYFSAELITHRITVDLKTYQASIELEIDTGPRYVFGTVNMQNEKFKESFLHRYLTFKPGDPYDARKLLNLRRTLADSDFFARADVITLVEQANDQQVPIIVDLEAKPDRRYSAGLGYATDTGPRARLGYERRRANTRGHHYNAFAERSEIEASFKARYFVPLRRPATDALSYSFTWLDENTVTSARTTTSVGTEITQQTGAWLRTAGVSFEREHYRVDISNDSNLLIPHVSWQRVHADQRIAPTHGWSLTFGVRGAREGILSDTSFVQPRAQGRYIFSPSSRSRVLLRATGGYSWVPDFQDLPVSQRFFAGGDNSIRGYAFSSLGPANADGVIVGGKNLLVGSAEYEHTLFGRTALALFMDAGNAFDNTAFHAMRGAGFGLRWSTPIGSVRLDLAQALSLPDRPWRLHLTLGPDL
ncbi:MAG: autotransporter assembly complex protein TamA [Chromatiales bacterium]|jgi:translocation and assembly module TamA|nr:autotransporter assembly complex protein TamA [Chromatiales bacterium]